MVLGVYGSLQLILSFQDRKSSFMVQLLAIFNRCGIVYPKKSKTRDFLCSLTRLKGRLRIARQCSAHGKSPEQMLRVDCSRAVFVSLSDEGWKMDVQRKKDGADEMEKVKECDMPGQDLQPDHHVIKAQRLP